MTRMVDGEVVRLRCNRCGSLTDNVVFSGENDMATAGLVSLASSAGPEVVIAEAANDEWRNQNYGVLVERRVSTELGRQDLHFVPLLGAVPDEPTQPVSFQEFRSAYRPPRLIFACLHCDTGEATAEAKRSFGQFEDEGGKLTVVGHLKLPR